MTMTNSHTDLHVEHRTMTHSSRGIDRASPDRQTVPSQSRPTRTGGVWSEEKDDRTTTDKQPTPNIRQHFSRIKPSGSKSSSFECRFTFQRLPTTGSHNHLQSEVWTNCHPASSVGMSRQCETSPGSRHRSTRPIGLLDAIFFYRRYSVFGT